MWNCILDVPAWNMDRFPALLTNIIPGLSLSEATLCRVLKNHYFISYITIFHFHLTVRSMCTRILLVYCIFPFSEAYLIFKMENVQCPMQYSCNESIVTHLRHYHNVYSCNSVVLQTKWQSVKQTIQYVHTFIHSFIHSYIHSLINDCTALCWALASFSVS
jgi:hypothetical protein